ncbi:MAG: hypothetical protein WDO73_25255 [Ignavibacteriota bacterium]
MMTLERILAGMTIGELIIAALMLLCVAFIFAMLIELAITRVSELLFVRRRRVDGRVFRAHRKAVYRVSGGLQ